MTLRVTAENAQMLVLEDGRHRTYGVAKSDLQPLAKANPVSKAQLKRWAEEAEAARAQ